MLTLVRSQPKGNLTPGPDLDLEVARVLGLEVSDSIPPFSTDDNAAITLAESFSRKWGFWEYVKLEVDGSWTVGWIAERQPLHPSMKPIQATAATRALAICRSILKVVASARDRGDPPGHPRTR